MLEEMLNYLKVKQELVNKENFSHYKSKEEQIRFLNSLIQIMYREEMFLSLDPAMADNVKQTLEEMSQSENEQIKSKATLLKQKMDATIHNYSVPSEKKRDDYYQWISLVRTPESRELSSMEQLDYAKADYENMKALLKEEDSSLVGNFSFLGTLNFTMWLFRGVYQQHPELLTRSEIVIERGMENASKTYKKKANGLLHTIDKHHQKEHQKEYCKRV